MLEIRDLRYAWPGAGADVLSIAELQLDAGRTHFLHGPSGCGKSTLLALMAGVLLPCAGTVSLLGQNWAALRAGARDARRAELVGLIFQQFNLLPYLSVLDNVLLPARLSPARAQRCQGGPVPEAQALLRRMDLPAALWPRRADALSVGQQQRVAAARALLGRPPLVIADEPTSALDAPLREAFVELLLEQVRAGGSTLVFVSHDERLASRFDERLSLPEINLAAVQGETPAAVVQPAS